MSTWNEHVFPHGELTGLAPGLWAVQGTLGKSPLPRSMVIWSLPDGGLLIHSGIALDDPGMAALEALGEPRILVVPNRMHRADAGVYKERYPDLVVCCPASARQAVAKVVPVDDVDTALLEPLGVVVHAAAGEGAFEHILELPVSGGAALVCADSMFNIREHLPGFAGFMARHVSRSTGFFGVTGLGRMFLGKGKAPFKQWLLDQASRDDLLAFVPGHGAWITQDVAGALRSAAQRL